MLCCSLFDAKFSTNVSSEPACIESLFSGPETERRARGKTVGPLAGSGLRYVRGFDGFGSVFAAKLAPERVWAKLASERVRASRIRLGSISRDSRWPTGGRDAGFLSSFFLGFDGGLLIDQTYTVSVNPQSG